MAIDPDELKWYQCDEWEESATHGGVIDTTATITDNTMNNVFDDVSDAERIAGDTDYRKIFFRNENADDYSNIKVWIETNTPADDAVHIALGTSDDTADIAATYDFYQPDSKLHADVLEPGTLGENASFGLWIKRVVPAEADGYENNSFVLKVENS